MHGDPPHLWPDDLDLAHVDAGTDLDAHPVQSLHQIFGAVDGPGGLVERREKAVAGGVNLPTPVAFQNLPHEGVVLGQEMTPAAITELRREIGGSDDVGEHHRSQEALGGASSPRHAP
jgi:hypothetical protein